MHHMCTHILEPVSGNVYLRKCQLAILSHNIEKLIIDKKQQHDSSADHVKYNLIQIEGVFYYFLWNCQQ